jgi:hypothetical protein
MKRSTAKRLDRKLQKLIGEKNEALRFFADAPTCAKILRKERDTLVECSVELRRVANKKKVEK